MFSFLVTRPGLILWLGGLSCLVLFLVSLLSGYWHWFPRGGALMTLAGFLVSVREALLYRPKRERTYDIVGFEGFIRTTPLGGIAVNPSLPIFDPRLTAEEIEEQREEMQRAWDEAVAWGDAEEPPVKDEGDEGRPMRDLSDMNAEELSQLRTAAVFGVLGTFIWAFGDLLGGLPN